MNTIWSPEKVERLLKLIEEGKSANSIGKELGHSKASVARKLHKLKVSRKVLASRNIVIRSLADSTLKSLDREASMRGEGTATFITHLLEAIVANKLVDAILNDEDD